MLTSPNVRPPVARKEPRVDIVHGDRREDDYFWLRRKEDPEVTAYLEAENAYTDAVMKLTEDFQARLYDEMLARIKEDDTSVPYRRGGHFYYVRTETGQAVPDLLPQGGQPRGAGRDHAGSQRAGRRPSLPGPGALHGVGRRPSPGL